ncbi:solute carrier organic anion transporter family member 4C1-like [Haliotis rufescens]|uniref:solute carrier organic anion transporter family member 4C1-like n=1 Tax=Haliotis rufescens TaxID=6454 RepID=UPI00201EA740|nr:solute carrier organic anion transporter family member 4C1-like [Haliotis rufescens]
MESSKKAEEAATDRTGNTTNRQEEPQQSKQEDDSCLYGWGSFKPRCLQPMNTLPWFTAWSVVFILAWSSCSLGPGIPHIEKQFGLTSKMTAVLTSCLDIGGVSIMLFVSFIGTRYNMAKGLAIGAFVNAIGALVFCIPHFFYEAPKFENVENASNADICPLSAISTAVNDSSPTSVLYTTYAFMVVGDLLRGFGTTVIFTLGTAYIDENGKYPLSTLFITVTYAASEIGGSANAVLSGYIMDNVYVDFDKVDQSQIPDPKDPNWIGAWWLNFTYATGLFLLTVVPLYGYPKRLPGNQGNSGPENDKEDKVVVSGNTLREMIKNLLRDFANAARRLLFNLEFVLLSVASAVSTCAAIGIGVFSYKFLTMQYDVNFQVAGYISGTKSALSGLGYIAGSAVIRRFNLHALGIERLSFGLSLASAIMSIGLLARCPNVQLAGVEVPYLGENATNGLLAECQRSCQCQGHPFNPVCGADDIVYYSPCHAGCTDMMVNGSDRSFTNCSCIQHQAESSSDLDPTARSGQCETGCYGVYISTPFTFLMTLFMVISISNESIATLRCVDQDLRPFALGVQWVIMRLLGNIPSPVFIGAILDAICLVWSDPVPGVGTRYCQVYDKEKLAYGFCFTWLSANLLSAFLFLMASFVNVRRNKTKEMSAERETGPQKDEDTRL